MSKILKIILGSILGILLIPTVVWGFSVTWNKLVAGQIFPPLVGDKVSIGTTTPSAQLTVWGILGNIFNVVDSASTTRLVVSGTGFGTTTVTGLTINGSATSTSNVGWNLTNGCYAVNDTCISGSGGGLTRIAIIGARDDDNMTFTAASEPKYLVINGGWYEPIGGAITWSYISGTITLSTPVGTGGSIFGFN